MNKEIKVVFTILTLLILLSGCAYPDSMINVISREDGSGTRDAFTSLFELTQKDENGSEIDQTVPTSEITNSTAVVLQTVSEDPNAIGYMSMGSLNDHVKAVEINNVEPTPENVKSKEYPIFRPFILIENKDSGSLEDDFISFTQSSQGQKVIEENGYIPVDSATNTYNPSGLEGKIVINGSSSVTPVIEALSEEYKKINPKIDVEVQQTDSTTGVSTITEGISDIGMSSRELKPEEIANGLTPIVFAYDGLAVIVNNDNPIDNLSIQDVHDIYTGKLNLWEDLEV